MSNQNPVCITCRIEYRPFAIGRICVARRADATIDHVLWGDVWYCPGCDHRLVLKFGEREYRTPENFIAGAKADGREVLDFWGTALEKSKAEKIVVDAVVGGAS